MIQNLELVLRAMGVYERVLGRGVTKIHLYLKNIILPDVKNRMLEGKGEIKKFNWSRLGCLQWK